MYRHIALLCVFALLCACGPLPQYNKSGLWGKYQENYVDSDGFTLWMPRNMNARQGMYPYVVQRYINYCKNGNYIGGKYEPIGDVYKELPNGTKIYAYYYYYTDDVDVGVDSIAFNLHSTQMKINYDVVFNIHVNKNGDVIECKFMRIQGGTSTY